MMGAVCTTPFPPATQPDDLNLREGDIFQTLRRKIRGENAPVVPFPIVSSQLQPSNPLEAPNVEIEKPCIHILHFNDCHTIVPNKLITAAGAPVGGATRFATLLKKKRQECQCLLLFSGDCFNPSLMSTVTKGKHVAIVLKALRVDCGTYGNHDFDFGPDELIKLAEASAMPWVMTNVIDNRNGKPVANAQKHHILEKFGYKIGLIGIVEEEWLVTIRDLPEYVQYQEKVQTAQAEIAILKEKGCQIIIALTHMRENNDNQFLRDISGVDLLLGGHDHFYKVSEVNGVKWVKSSADFMNATLIKMRVKDPGGRPVVTTEKIPITADIEEDLEIKDILDKYQNELAEKVEKDLCRLGCQLDVCTESVRTSEVAIGNFIADVMKEEMKCDCSIVNSGVLRANLVYLPGLLRIKDLLDIIPIEDIVISIRIKGVFVKQALECGVSRYPMLEGRFPQVSGIRFAMDPNLPPNNRITEIRIKNRPLKPDKVYTLATTVFLGNGGDGYTALKQYESHIVDAENGRILPTMVRQYITDLLGRPQKVEKKTSLDELKSNHFLTKMEKQNSIIGIRKAYLPKIAPTIDGRIIIQPDARLPRTNSISSAASSTTSSMFLSVRRPMSRRTSMSHPIPLEHTLANITPSLHGLASPTSFVGSNGSDSQFSSARSSARSQSHPRPVVPLNALNRFSSTLSEIGNELTSVTEEKDDLFDFIYRGERDMIVECLRAARNPGSLINQSGGKKGMEIPELRKLGLGRTIKDKVPPLHMAVAMGEFPVIELLLKHNADPNIQADCGGTARDLAYAHMVMAMAASEEAAYSNRKRIFEFIDEFQNDHEKAWFFSRGSIDS